MSNNMVWGSVTAYMGIDRLKPLVDDLRTALGTDSQVEVKDLEITGRDVYSVGFVLRTAGNVSESSVMDVVRAISESDGYVYFMDTRNMTVNNFPTVTLYDLSRSRYPVVDADYGISADVHSFLDSGEVIVTEY